jgi:thiaminase
MKPDRTLTPQSTAFERATQHPFLTAAGDGSLDEDVLVRWLRQDYLYAYVGYIKVRSIAHPPLRSHAGEQRPR